MPLLTTIPDESADPMDHFKRVDNAAQDRLLSGTNDTGEEAPKESPGIMGEVLLAPFRGAEGAVKSVYNLGDFITGDALPDWNKRFLGTSKSGVGKVAEGIFQFLAGFVPVGGALSKLGSFKALGALKGGKVAQAAISGAGADFLAFDGQEERLSNLIQSVPALQNPITAFLESDKEDNQLVGRLKNSLEGVGLGVASDALIAGLRGLKAGRSAKEAGKSGQAAFEEALEAQGGGKGVEASIDKARAKEAPSYEVPKEAAEAMTPDSHTLKPDLELGKRLESKPTPWEPGVKTMNTSYLRSTWDVLNTIDREAENLRKALPKPETLEYEAFMAKTAKAISDMNGRSPEAVLSDMRIAMVENERAIGMAGAAAQRALTHFELQVQFSKMAARSKDIRWTHEAARQAQLAKEFLSVAGGFKNIQGKALKSNQFLLPSTDLSYEVALQNLDEMGGEAFVASTVKKWAMAETPLAMAKLMRKQTLVGRLLRIHNEYWINSILSGPTTAVVNLIGNAFTSLFLPAERALGAAFTGEGSVIKAAVKQYSYMLASIEDSLKAAGKAWRTGDENLFNAPVSDVVEAKAISSENISQLAPGMKPGSGMAKAIDYIGEKVNLPTRFLMTTDSFFKHLNYRSAAMSDLYMQGAEYGLKGDMLEDFVKLRFDGLIRKSGERFSEAAVTREAIELASQQGLEGKARRAFIDEHIAKQYNNESSILAEMKQASDYGESFAREATFTENLGELGQAGQNVVKRFPGLQLIFPFVRTPTNLLKFPLRRAPLFGMAKVPGTDLPIPLLNDINLKNLADLNSKNPQAVAAAHGRLASGMLLFSGAAMASLKGHITGGGPKDPEERRLLQETGWQPYSIKVGDNYVSYKRADPFASFLGIVADWGEIAARDENRFDHDLLAFMNGAVSGLTRNITNKSYLAGLSQWVEALNDPERWLIGLGERQVASYVPNLLGQAVTAFGNDDVQREYRGFFDRAIGRIPGASHFLEPRRNLVGEPVDAQIASLPLLGKRGDWVSPIVTTKDKKDPVFNELSSMAHGFQSPSHIYRRAIDMTGFRDTKGQSAYDRWLELHGQVKLDGRDLRGALQILFQTKAYKRLDGVPASPDHDSPKVAEVRRVINKYRQKALEQVFREYKDFKAAAKQHKLVGAARRTGRTAEQINSLIEMVN